MTEPRMIKEVETLELMSITGEHSPDRPPLTAAERRERVSAMVRLFADLAPGRSLSEELIADRRAEAKREE